VAAVALVISVGAGLLLASARMSKPPVSWLASIYVNVFRGMPALVSVIWVYFGLSLVLGINFSVFQAGVIALVLLYSAFISEIYRPRCRRSRAASGRLDSPWDASGARVRPVTLPQATKIAIPNIGSMFIGMIKDTSTFTSSACWRSSA
jgi:His/Glu/Gln/Arg/opine family amino acid ABC transporter permease subunit